MLGGFRRRRTTTPDTERHNGSGGVPRWPLEAWQHDDLDADDPAYVKLCVTPAFPAGRDTRSLGDDDALNRIIETAQANGSKSAAMAELIGELLADPRYAAMDALYSWLAPVYEGTDRQIEVIDEGLRTCPCKFYLLEVAGHAMLDRGRTGDALYYWAQSVMNAESTGDGQDARAYDFLVAVAHLIGESKAAKIFKARTGEAGGPEIALDDETTDRVRAAFQKPTKTMKTVVRTLSRQVSA